MLSGTRLSSWVAAVAVVLAWGSTAEAEEWVTCTPVSLAEVEKLTSDAYLDIQLVDYPAAIAKLDAARNAFPCLTEPVAVSTLTDYYLFRGLALYYREDREGAVAQFSQALAVDPSLRWRTEFGQRPRSAFLDAREIRLEVASGAVHCPLLAPGVSAYVDGREATQGDTWELPAGEHLLQVLRSDGQWQGHFFTVPEDEEIPLPVPDEVRLRTRLFRLGRDSQPAEGDTESTEERGRAAWLQDPSLPVYAAAGVSGVALVSAGYFGVRYWSTRTRLYGGGYTSTEDDPEKEQLLTDNYRAAILADVSLAVAVVAAGTAYGLHVTRPADSEAGRHGPVLAFVLTPQAAWLHGTFR